MTKLRTKSIAMTSRGNLNDREFFEKKIKLEPQTEFNIIEIDDRIFAPDFPVDSKTPLDVGHGSYLDGRYDEMEITDEIFKEEPVFDEVENPALEMDGSSGTNEMIQSPKQLKSHEHFADKSFECNFCHRRFTSKERLQKHERVHTNNKPFQCHICLKKYNQRLSLQVHKSVHTGEKPYLCSQCMMQFRLKAYLDRHMKKHDNGTIQTENVNRFACSTEQNVSTEPIPELLLGFWTYECYLCQFRSQFNRTKMKMHFHTEHTGGKLFECYVCSKQFLKKESMSKHSRTHSATRPLKCDHCEKGFITKHDLKRHIQSHNKESEVFQCNFCPKKLSTKKLLKTHLKTHTALKPYVCGFCGKRFLRNGCLTRHKRTHTNERNFQCGICQMTFSRNHLLTDHKRKIHKT